MNMLNASQTPHVRSELTTRMIMLLVIISLLPTTIYGIIHFGVIKPLIVILATIASCVISETVFNIIVKKKNTISDLSCVVTGLILALNMPPEINPYIPIVGGVFAIVVIKMLYGGLGQNFMNPALGARCFLVISFAGAMNNFRYGQYVDAETFATPLADVAAGKDVANLDLFFGNIPGTIGEVSTICILIGAIFLLVLKVIDIKIPLSYIISFVVFLIIFGAIKGLNISDPNFILAHILGGGLIFGAFYMATDYVTSPVTPFGRILFGIFLGLLTAIFRVFGKSPEGVSYAIIIANLVVPLIEGITIPKPFGKESDKNEK